MPTAPITESEVRSILGQEMRIDESVDWLPKSDQSYVECTLRIKHPQRGIGLALKLTANLRASEKYSFSILLNGSHRIVGVDICGSHKNWHTDGNEWRRTTHQHHWTDACHGEWAFSPPAMTEEMEQAFKEFCNRLGIVFTGRWHDCPPLQLGLDDA